MSVNQCVLGVVQWVDFYVFVWAIICKLIYSIPLWEHMRPMSGNDHIIS